MPLAAQRLLVLCQRYKLVGLDVRPVGNSNSGATILPAPQIAIDDVDVDDRHRRLKILETVWRGVERKEIEDVHSDWFRFARRSPGSGTGPKR